MGATIRIRKSIDDLDPAGSELKNYIHALGKLIEISNNDPDSTDGYLYFAALHDDLDVGPCEHGQDTFLPWHRAHLYMFEEALRRSDPPVTSDVTLPYWDWSKFPTGERFPKVFEDTSTILFKTGRATKRICHAGETPATHDCERLPFPRQWIESDLLSIPKWAGVDGFGGEAAGESNCKQHLRPGYGQLESPPHNKMHDSYVAGVMSDPSQAALDPIFWSFHCYIDLLWAQWQQISGHRVDTCLECRLCGLFKVQGQPDRWKVKDVLDTVGQMGYRYEYTPAVPTPHVMMLAEELRAFPSHPAVDFVLSGKKEPEVVRTLDIVIPDTDFERARIRISGVRLNNPFTYEGNVFLTPQGEAFNPRDAEFRERYLVGLYTIWKGHVGGHGNGHDGDAEHGGHGGHGGHVEKDIEVVVDLTKQLKSLAQTNGGETWTVTVAVVARTPDGPGVEASSREGLESDASLEDYMQFQDMKLETEAAEDSAAADLSGWPIEKIHTFAFATADEAVERAPVFELHIRPLFRLLDRDHMVSSVDLGDLNSVWKNRAGILAKVKPGGNMPPTNYGGPWPQEWISLFERWLATGDDTNPGHHLVVAAPNSDGYKVRQVFGGKIELTAVVTVPSQGYRAWFEPLNISATTREYILYTEPPFPPQAAGQTSVGAFEKFKKGTVTTIVINDADGRKEIPI